jgi:hypothetical protein
MTVSGAVLEDARLSTPAREAAVRVGEAGRHLGVDSHHGACRKGTSVTEHLSAGVFGRYMVHR